MVSLRRDRLSSADQPLKNEPEPDPIDHISLRNKRNRAVSSANESPQQDLHKRRKLANNSLPQKLHIPLRGRTSLSKPTTDPRAAGELPTPATSIDSPTPKAQYDQFRRVEEKARAAIQKNKTDEDDRRKLRSEHGGSRSKSELAQYFPNYDDMLSLEPPDPRALTARSKVILLNDTPDFAVPPPRPDPFGSHKPLHNTQIILLDSLSAPRRTTAPDPMAIEAYAKTHRQKERHEKQMKNGDRERSQHEKYQLERLLEDLRGPDWLKTLGISGITETEKRRYEPKRALFVRETQALIDKFKWWKEEEKRRKVERELALAEEAAELVEAEGGTTDAGSERSSAVASRRRSVPSKSSRSSQPPTGSSEIDALASQQLLVEEARSSSGGGIKNGSKRRRRNYHHRQRSTEQSAAGENMAATRNLPALPPPPSPPPEKPLVSFFAKKHLRDAAVSGRQRGRTVLAFGHPVPEMPEEGMEWEFELPGDILTEDAIRASQRSGRRRRRGDGDGG